MNQSDPGPPPAKKRKIQRACDHCRKYKRKCDGPVALDNICSLCKSAHRECTYLEASRPRGPPKAYVTSLEDRVEHLERLLSKLRPGEDFTEELGPPVIRGSWKTDSLTAPSPGAPALVGSEALIPPNVPITHALASIIYPYAHDHRGGTATPTPPLVMTTRKSRAVSANTGLKTAPSKPTQSTDVDSSSEGHSYADEEGDSLAEGLRQLTLETKWDMNLEEDWSNFRFIGKASGMDLIGATMRSKFEYQGSTAKLKTVACPAAELPAPLLLRRREAWRIGVFEWTWEGDYRDYGHTPDIHSSLMEHFPPPDLAKELLDLYFSYVNPIYPIFHRPLFMRQYTSRTYEEDYWFASLCLLIFSLASRWSNDPRVLPDGDLKIEQSDEAPPDWRRAGFTWFQLALNVVRLRHSFVRPPSLFEIQTFPLLSLYLRGTSSAPSSRIFISLGLKKCQDAGAHRRNKYGSKPSYQDELWKRAFWCLVVLDRFNSAAWGHPCGLCDDHFDVNLPLEVDDQYWPTEAEEGTWDQPPDKPAFTSIAFRHLIKLSSIVSLMLGPYSAVAGAREFLGTQIRDWQEKVAREINQICEDWIASIPAPLKWSAEADDEVVSNLSANLYLSYHQLRILLYRPFISTQSLEKNSRQDGALHRMALDTCLEAARNCLQILTHSFPGTFWAVPELISSASASAALFSIRIWELKGEQRKCSASGNTPDPAWETEIEKLSEDVESALRILKTAHPKWEQATSMLNLLKTCLPNSQDVPTPLSRTLSACSESERRQSAGPSSSQPLPPYGDHTSLTASSLSEACSRTTPHETSQQHTTWSSQDLYSSPKHDYQWPLAQETQAKWVQDSCQCPSTLEDEHTSSSNHATDYRRELPVPSSTGAPHYVAQTNLSDLPYHSTGKPYEHHVLQHRLVPLSDPSLLSANGFFSRYPPMANTSASYEQHIPSTSYSQPTASTSYNPPSTSAPYTHPSLPTSPYSHPSTPALLNPYGRTNEGQDIYISHYHQSRSRLPYRPPEPEFTFQYPP